MGTYYFNNKKKEQMSYYHPYSSYYSHLDARYGGYPYRSSYYDSPYYSSPYARSAYYDSPYYSRYSSPYYSSPYARSAYYDPLPLAYTAPALKTVVETPVRSLAAYDPYYYDSAYRYGSAYRSYSHLDYSPYYRSPYAYA